MLNHGSVEASKRSVTVNRLCVSVVGSVTQEQFMYGRVLSLLYCHVAGGVWSVPVRRLLGFVKEP